jgi:FAD:protein FMN transferase
VAPFTLFSLLLLTASGSSDAAVSESRQLMGTVVAITLLPEADLDAQLAITTAFAEFERVEKVMNEWRPDSELSLVNAAAGSGKPTVISGDLCSVLEASLTAARRTRGLFDPTWAALRGLWRFGTDQSAAVPPKTEIERACKLVRYRDVVLMRTDGGASCTVLLKHSGMKLGLGGVAKGWAVDRAVAALRSLGWKNFLVQAGGDLYAAGTKEGRPWRVGIRDPRGSADDYFTKLEISDAAFSTTGDYERFFEINGRRYHHIIDPRTCYPATASRSVTVLARTALEAEFVTKPAFIAGGERGLKLADEWGVSAVIVTSDNKIHVSKAIGARLSR